MNEACRSNGWLYICINRNVTGKPTVAQQPHEVHSQPQLGVLSSLITGWIQEDQQILAITNLIFSPYFKLCYKIGILIKIFIYFLQFIGLNRKIGLIWYFAFRQQEIQGFEKLITSIKSTSSLCTDNTTPNRQCFPPYSTPDKYWQMTASHSALY